MIRNGYDNTFERRSIRTGAIKSVILCDRSTDPVLVKQILKYNTILKYTYSEVRKVFYNRIDYAEWQGIFFIQKNFHKDRSGATVLHFRQLIC